MIWTDDADRLLIKMWNTGASLALVAEEMKAAGYDLTRNAIAGRKHRLPDKYFLYQKPPPKRKRERPQRSKTVETKKPVIPKPSPPPPTTTISVARAFDLSTWEGVDYLSLKSDGCKAILDKRGSDGLPKVCGRAQGFTLRGDRSVYCPEHTKLYTTQPKAPTKRVT